MLDNIQFEYADGLPPSAFREIKSAEQANRFFEPYCEQINKQGATLFIHLPQKGADGYRFEGLDEDLDNLIARNFPILLRRHNDSKSNQDDTAKP